MNSFNISFVLECLFIYYISLNHLIRVYVLLSDNKKKEIFGPFCLINDLNREVKRE